MFNLKVAQTVIEIDNHFEYIREQCFDYITDEVAEYSLSINLNEIEKERNGNMDYPLGYCESLATYRRICQILIEKKIFLFHGSFFSYLNQGILFIGPSGVGKTTQMNKIVNRSPEKIKIINGDKPLFCVRGNQLIGFGTPWAGKENKQLNTSESLKAIYVIVQSNKNYVEKVNIAESIQLILSQLFFPNQKDGNLILIKIVQEVILKIPVYKFYNTLDHELTMEDILKISN